MLSLKIIKARLARINSKIKILEATFANNSSFKYRIATKINRPVKRIEIYGVFSRLSFLKMGGRRLSLLMAKGYLDAVIIPELAVEIKAKKAPMLSMICKVSPPNTRAPSEIGVRLFWRAPGFRTPTVIKITSA